MYPVSANFHTLAIQDAPKTRVRIYFIGDAVDCTDDNAVQTNGTLLIGKAGDTDSNGRIGQNGITFSEFFNPDKNIQVGAAVSSQIGMTLLNTDGALDNFQYGRCKVYLDVYDTANSSWLTCPMGVYIIDLPTKRKAQLINANGYDQMQKLDEICDTWWSTLNWSGGITLSQLLTSLATKIGVSVSSNTASAIVNGSVSFTEEPFQCIEVTYREVLEYIAEATGTVARFDRNGALDLRWFAAAQISGNTVTVNTDTVGNQCLAISVAEYSVAAVDLLKVKLYTDDIGTTVGTGTNQYTIVNNLFLDGANSSTIIAKATPIYNRLHGLGAYSPVSARVIMDWSIEAGDIINIVNDGTTYSVPIFQQSMAWRGGYVVSDLLSDGDNVRPVLDYDERTYYRLNSEMSKKVGDDEIISKINQSPEAITIQANKVNLTGYVTFTNLSTPGQTTIDGGNITTGTIDASVVSVTNLNASNITSGTMSANKISGGTLSLGGQNNTNGQLYIYDANGVLCGKIDNTGIEEYGDAGGYTRKLSIGAGYLTLSYAGFVLGVLNAGSSGGTHGGTLSLLGSSGYTRAYLSAVSGALILNDASGHSGIELNGASGIAWIRGLGANAGRGSLSIYGSQQTGYDENGTPIYVDSDGHRYQYFVDSSGHIATDLGRDTTRSFLTLNSPDGSSDIFLDTLPANGSRFNSPTTFNAAVTMKSTLDVTPRRCEATLSSAGWYRVFDYNAANEARVSGDIAFLIDVTVLEGARQSHKITLYGLLGALKFGDEVSVTGTSFVDKIRYVKSGNHGYIDIHYSRSVSRYIACYYDVKCVYVDNLNRFSATTPTMVGDSPSGETVLTEYTFAENVPESSNTIQRCPDGTLIQHGSAVNTAIGYAIITFDVPFANDTYSFIASPRYSVSYPSLSFRTITQKSSVNGGFVNFKQLTSTASYTGTDALADWIAIGRWKP